LVQYLCRFNTCYFLTNGFRNLDNNNLNGTLYIGNISSLSRKLHNGIIDGHLQSLSLTKNDISCVAYNSSDIHDVTIVISYHVSRYYDNFQNQSKCILHVIPIFHLCGFKTKCQIYFNILV